MKELLIDKINGIVNSLQLLNVSNNFTFIIEKYIKTKKYIKEEKLCQNFIKGSVRAYLDVSSDYNNPILDDMYELEKEIDTYIG